MEINSSELAYNLCTECGNEKGTGPATCTICNRHRPKTSSTPESPKSEKFTKQEIPKDENGKPKYGPGSDKWEESKRKLGIN